MSSTNAQNKNLLNSQRELSRKLDAIMAKLGVESPAQLDATTHGLETSMSGEITDNPAEVLEKQAMSLPEVLNGDMTLSQGVDMLWRQQMSQQDASKIQDAQAKSEAERRNRVAAFAKSQGIEIELGEPEFQDSEKSSKSKNGTKNVARQSTADADVVPSVHGKPSVTHPSK